MEGAVFSGKLCAQAIGEDWNSRPAAELPAPAAGGAKQPALA